MATKYWAYPHIIILHRLHYSNDGLVKIYLNVDAKCLRCHQGSMTVGHMFWSCQSLSGLWDPIFEALSHMCNTTVSPNPVTAIFGVHPLDQNATSLLARHLVLFHRKSAKQPSFMQWVKEVMSSLPLEKVRYTVHGSRQRFNLTWSPINTISGEPVFYLV